MTTLLWFLVNNEALYFFYFTKYALSPWPPLPPLFSLTIPNKKQQEQVAKIFLNKNKCM